MAELVITNENFEKEILNAGKPAVVDFWAPWCGPCRMMGPIIEEFAKEYVMVIAEMFRSHVISELAVTYRRSLLAQIHACHVKRYRIK